jgi:hypothetical protein
MPIWGSWKLEITRRAHGAKRIALELKEEKFFTLCAMGYAFF